jgi:hypothetical protein
MPMCISFLSPDPVSPPISLIGVRVIFQIHVKLRKNPDVNQLLVIKDELDHVFDWTKWVNDGAAKKLAELQKNLKQLPAGFDTFEKCEDGAEKMVNDGLRNSAHRANLNTLKFDELLHHFPRRTKKPSDYDKFKPFPFNILP